MLRVIKGDTSVADVWAAGYQHADGDLDRGPILPLQDRLEALVELAGDRSGRQVVEFTSLIGWDDEGNVPTQSFGRNVPVHALGRRTPARDRAIHRQANDGSCGVLDACRQVSVDVPAGRRWVDSGHFAAMYKADDVPPAVDPTSQKCY